MSRAAAYHYRPGTHRAFLPVQVEPPASLAPAVVVDESCVVECGPGLYLNKRGARIERPYVFARDSWAKAAIRLAHPRTQLKCVIRAAPPVTCDRCDEKVAASTIEIVHGLEMCGSCANGPCKCHGAPERDCPDYLARGDR